MEADGRRLEAQSSKLTARNSQGFAYIASMTNDKALIRIFLLFVLVIWTSILVQHNSAAGERKVAAAVQCSLSLPAPVVPASPSSDAMYSKACAAHGHLPGTFVAPGNDGICLVGSLFSRIKNDPKRSQVSTRITGFITVILGCIISPNAP